MIVHHQTTEADAPKTNRMAESAAIPRTIPAKAGRLSEPVYFQRPQTQTAIVTPGPTSRPSVRHLKGRVPVRRHPADLATTGGTRHIAQSGQSVAVTPPHDELR